jgi:hypothetical protein
MHTGNDAATGAYLRGAMYVEFLVLGLYWVGLAIALAAKGLFSELLPLLVVGFHFGAPFAALEVLAFLEERHAAQKRPAASEMTRWIAQGVSALITDSIGLTYALGTFHEAFEDHVPLGTANVVFLVLLVLSTVSLCLVMIVFWQRHTRAAAGQQRDVVDALIEATVIRNGLQGYYYPDH